jgi:WD40 repeat protein
MPNGPKRLFISYARADGQECANALRQRLQEAGFSLWHDRTDMEGGRDWWNQIDEALRQVEYMLLVMTPRASRSEVVTREWRLARQRGVGVIPVLCGYTVDFAALPRWMRETHFVDLTIDEQWRRLVRQLESPNVARRVPFMPPDVPVDFVDRPQEYQSIAASLLNREAPVAITAALKGAGGYGKTTLAIRLCHDERILEEFHDGVLWVTLGERPGDVTSKVIDMIETLSGERPGFADPDTAAAKLAELLADNDLLMVIDDVWNASDVRPFLRGGSRCARLITTRNSETLPEGCLRTDLDSMRSGEAVRLLGWQLPNAASMGRLAARLGEWPLLLKVVNGTLRKRTAGGESLETALDYVERVLDKRGLTGFDERNTSQRNRAAAVTLGVSIEQLTAGERSRFHELAIFPEDTDIPLAAIERLWRATGGLDELDTEDLCRRLFDISLLLRLDLALRTVRLHDVIRTILREQCRAELQAWNAALLKTFGARAWWDLPASEAYFWLNLPYHLEQAGLGDQLASLLFDYRWMDAKLRLWGVPALLDDYEAMPPTPDSLLVSQAIRLSAHAIASDHSQLASQLAGRLLGLGGGRPAIAALCHSVESRARKPWIRPRLASLEWPGGSLLRTYPGHSDKLIAVAASGDGRRVVAASWDEITVWDLESDRWLNAFPVHNDLSALALTCEGHAVTGHWDGTIHVWNLETGVAAVSIAGHSGAIHALAVTGAGELLSASGDQEIRIWDAATGAQSGALRGHRGAVTAIGVSATGHAAVSAGKDNTVRFWDLSRKTQIAAFERVKDISALAIRPDGAGAVSATWYGSLASWDAGQKAPVAAYGSLSGKINALAVTPDGAQVIAAGDDKTIHVWDFATGEEGPVFRGHSDRVSAVAVTSAGDRMVSASWDRTVKLWDLTRSTRAAGPEASEAEPIGALAISANGAAALSATKTGALRVWNAETGAGTLELRCMENPASAYVSDDGRHGLVVSELGELSVWDLSAGALLATAGYSADTNRIVAAPDGFRVLHRSTYGPVSLRDVVTGETVRTYPPSFQPESVTVDGRCAISMWRSSVIRRYRSDTGELHNRHWGYGIPVHSLAVASGAILVVAETPDGLKVLEPNGRVHSETPWRSPAHSTVLNTAGTHVVRVWNQDEMEILAFATGQSRRIRVSNVEAAAAADDGRMVLLGDFLGSVSAWDPAGNVIHELGAHADRITAAAISADGRRGVTGSLDGTVKVWDLQAGRILETSSKFSAVKSVAITRDGRRVAVLDYSLTVWDVDDAEGFYRSYQDHADEFAVALNTDGSEVITAAVMGHTPTLWDVETGTPLRHLPASFPWSAAVTVTAGRRLAFCFSRGWPVEVWDIHEGRALRHFGWEVSSMSVSSEGRRVAMVTRDGALSTWNAFTGEREQTFTADAPLVKCAIAQNGLDIAAGDSMGRVHFFTVIE